MSKSNNLKKKRNKKITAQKIVLNVIVSLILIWIAGSTLYFGIKTYNPKQKAFIRGANYAFSKIQDELYEYYKTHKYVYETKDEKTDKFCELLGEKLSKTKADCTDTGGIMKKNFTLKGKKIEIFGMEKPPFEFEGTLVKDFIIDANGEDKGENLIGVDRVPVRIYSTKRMGGLMSPVNCSHMDDKDLDIPYAKICNNSEEINFMATKIPFGFDVTLIGGKKGKSKKILRDVPFLRADCAAFGGEMAAGDYCDEKGIYWLEQCYDEYNCAVWQAKTKL